MHAVLLSEPELDRFGSDPIAAPVSRSWDFAILEAPFDLLEPADQILDRIDLAGLVRGPGTQPMTIGPRLEVGIGFLRAHPIQCAFHPDLHVHSRPVERHGRLRVGLQFGGLATLVVGVEDEAPDIDAFEEDHPQ